MGRKHIEQAYIILLYAYIQSSSKADTTQTQIRGFTNGTSYMYQSTIIIQRLCRQSQADEEFQNSIWCDVDGARSLLGVIIAEDVMARSWMYTHGHIYGALFSSQSWECQIRCSATVAFHLYLEIIIQPLTN
jgi:hypothetical protein